ncbi:hypothetical protein SShM2_109 [Synechococcus phage S-ShM2]|uniref:Uncharacterized protein n=3 Tax=Ahtivirus sagseatwo TaxID=2734079 RepID=A0A1D7SN40_9CAUD|nr:hypothetical protein SShM2_109 [Synechococcus phage S-ShM2]AGH57446.1 hypothetical protein CPLG_00192 [Cyanophage S-SSM2]AOO13217.1 hypothetical protein LIS021110_103 [Cyanophage S-RIM14]ADO97720.1 hypothetical protein SShM2_109 [Synechococcus phage S-ShM2]AOO13433.1 hypothetical protein LIS110610_103 [Cyanophage S-RIM14]AOO13649.1 hypothetical protein Np111211_103 [Cyanophage S-RIM14]
MIGFYVVFVALILFVAWAGVDGTMKLMTFIDLEFRYRWVLLRSYRMRHRLEEELGIVPTSLVSHVFPEERKK